MGSHGTATLLRIKSLHSPNGDDGDFAEFRCVPLFDGQHLRIAVTTRSTDTQTKVVISTFVGCEFDPKIDARETPKGTILENYIAHDAENAVAAMVDQGYAISFSEQVEQDKNMKQMAMDALINIGAL
jgi:hypothetical protein